MKPIRSLFTSTCAMRTRAARVLGLITIMGALALVTACERIPDMEFDATLDLDGPDLVRLDSGLRYLVLGEGTGEPAASGHQVEIRYTGWLSDGREFDSGSFPFALGGGGVIAGFDQGVEGMKVGERRTIVIPAELGYGETGAGGGLIPPGATLVFGIELTKITR